VATTPSPLDSSFAIPLYILSFQQELETEINPFLSLLAPGKRGKN